MKKHQLSQHRNQLNTKLEELPFVVKEVAELGRGEFRMIVGKSGYEQRIDD